VSTNHRCRQCSHDGLRWHSTGTPSHERWLGMCDRCGWMTAFKIGQGTGTLDDEDPLRTFLHPDHQPELKTVTPPWIRLFRLSQQPPWRVWWDHAENPCSVCDASVVFTTSESFPSVTCTYSLCLNCGDTSAHYKRPLTGRVLGALSGKEWSPPCPAVLKLRRSIFNERKWFFGSGETFEVEL
jgi:hypothetical protein